MRVYLFNVPAHGHTNPTLPVVRELTRRGVAVRYFTTPEFRASVEAAGADFADVSPLLPPEAARPEPNVFRLADLLLRATETMLDAWLSDVGRDPPDLIMHDSLCPWGRAFAHVSKVPSVGSVTTFVLRPATALTSPALLREIAAMWRESPAERRRFSDTARRLRAAYGLRVGGPLDLLSTFGDINVVYTSRALQPAARTLGGRFVFVGPSLGEASGDLDVALPPGKGLVYVSLGTVLNDAPSFYRACLEAFAGEPYGVVMSVGRAVDPASLGTAPPNVTVRPFVAQRAVLSRAGAFVTHGGMNSVHEALAAGVPMLVSPQGSDQRLVGERVRAVGAGLLAARTPSPAALRAGVRTLLSEARFRAASARIGHDGLALGGAGRAADVIVAACRR